MGLIPTREQINVDDSLDERVACEHFLGKSVAEAEALFRDNALLYQEDLMWMGPVAFRYYVTAIIRYIQSEAASGDPDIINCFAGLLEFRLEHEPNELRPIMDQLSSICRYVVERYQKFDVAPDIYGDMRTRFARLY